VPSQEKKNRRRRRKRRRGKGVRVSRINAQK